MTIFSITGFFYNGLFFEVPLKSVIRDFDCTENNNVYYQTNEPDNRSPSYDVESGLRVTCLTKVPNELSGTIIRRPPYRRYRQFALPA